MIGTSVMKELKKILFIQLKRTFLVRNSRKPGHEVLEKFTEVAGHHVWKKKINLST